MNAEEIKFFDDISGRWDEMEIHSLPPKVSELLAIVGVEKGDRVLDLGTGTGVLLPYLCEAVGEDGRVVAVDISEGMLSVARGKYSGLVPPVEFVRKDFEKEEIPGDFDLIFLYCVYPHLSAPVETIGRLVSGNLRPSGRLIIGFPTGEDFINNIHRERKVESGLLPPATELARRLVEEGFDARVLPSSGYLVEIRKGTNS